MEINGLNLDSKIPLYEIEDVLSMPYKIIMNDVLQHRFADLCALQGNEAHYELMKNNLKFLNRLGLAVVQMYKNKEVYDSYYYFVNPLGVII